MMFKFYVQLSSTNKSRRSCRMFWTNMYFRFFAVFVAIAILTLGFQVRAFISRCLAFAPTDRPTAKEVLSFCEQQLAVVEKNAAGMPCVIGEFG